MGNLSADSRKKRWRKIGRVGGAIAAVVVVAGGIVWASVGGTDTSTSGDYEHSRGTRSATELAITSDASPL